MTENNGILVFLGCLILAAALVFSGRSWTDLLLRYGQSCWINSSTICAVTSLAKVCLLSDPWWVADGLSVGWCFVCCAHCLPQPPSSCPRRGCFGGD